MSSNIFLKILFAPFALVYGALVSLREFSYRIGLQRSSRFDVPTVCIGNLTTGGAGKSPHTEYLIRLLAPYISIAVLSRGYRRQTVGFRFVQPEDTALDVGDEPLQFKQKFPALPIAVGEKRAYAIPQILMRFPETQTILLDDAFQHLAVKPYLNILLTEYRLPFTRDFLLPSGNLREWRSGARRANIIVVSKCPSSLQLVEKQRLINEIAPSPHQRVYFSYYDYATPHHIFDPSVFFDLTAETDVLLLTAIARVDYLVDFLKTKVSSITTMSFEDHRVFTNFDIAHARDLFEKMKTTSRRCVVLTTEKDATRLDLHRPYLVENQLDVFAIPVEVKFLFDDGVAFDADIKQALLYFKI